MELRYLPANAAWAFVWNDDLVKMEGHPRFFSDHGKAVAAARERGLVVYTNGIVITTDEYAEAHAEHSAGVPVGQVRRCSCGDQTFVPGWSR